MVPHPAVAGRVAYGQRGSPQTQGTPGEALLKIAPRCARFFGCFHVIKNQSHYIQRLRPEISTDCS